MVTLGIDLASQPAGTAAALVEWGDDAARARPVELGCDDARLDALIEEAEVVGIDAPLGWPQPFVEAVAGWPHHAWDAALRDRLRFRATDFAARERLGRWPLSVSTDLVALPAMRAMALLTRHGVTDRGGDGRFFEVYPRGSLEVWGLYRSGYKRERSKRRELLQALKERLPWLEFDLDDVASTDHGLDALSASLTARAAAQGRTEPAVAERRELARSEGWIHLPNDLPSP